MPATAARAAFVAEELRSAVWQDPSVQALYGKVARDTADSPIDTYFDSMADVQTMANERGALLGAHVRAFRLQLADLVDLDGDFSLATALPGARVRIEEAVADMACAIVSIESYDTAAETTTLALWGHI